MTDAGLASRRAALRALAAIRAGRHLEGALADALRGLDADGDRRLAHELVAGVLRRQGTLDAELAPRGRRGWGSVAPALQDVLRLALYQLRHLDRVPPHAAVSTAVSLAREVGGARAGGFVNAVLRGVGSGGGAGSPAGGRGGGAEALAEAHATPVWLVRRWAERWGLDETTALLAWNDRPPPLVCQPARWGAERLLDTWRAAGITVTPAPWGAGLIPDRSRPRDLPGYAEGAFVVQDGAQALVAWFADPPPGAVVYDACAAPGGKAIALERLARRVVAGDLNPVRVRRLAENLGRAGGGRAHAVVADARHPPVAAADVVLLDAPCLATGTFRRHPDARGRVREEHLAPLVTLQRELLAGVADVVRPGGRLVYATCSLEPEEGPEQVEWFLAQRPDFVRDPGADLPVPLLTAAGDLMLLPTRHQTDGAFAARLLRLA